MTFFTGLLIGFVTGGLIGFITFALMRIGKDSDEFEGTDL